MQYGELGYGRVINSFVPDWVTAASEKIKDALWENGLRPLITTPLSMLMQILPLGSHRGH